MDGGIESRTVASAVEKNKANNFSIGYYGRMENKN